MDFTPIGITAEKYAFSPIRHGIHNTLGLSSPFGRLGLYTSLYAAGLYATKPDRVFTPTGALRPWLLVPGSDEQTGTYFPAWLEAFTAGLILHLFI